ncbi:hypothetical protein [Halobellus litoreus]|uniref:Ribbon-helix-helix protein, copG family n=1 Tax=Halobellus litoreus TaxID=755310 RepID=A0ABD6DW18_9EURY|nr:hypothetical protein [Halobellus litoreus]
MSERVQIPLRVSPSKKEEWARYQEELGFGSREAMIRRSVEYFHATQTGSGDDELADEVSTQLDSLNQKLVNLQAEVSEMHADQLDREDIPDIAEEIDYVLSESKVLDTFAEFKEGQELVDGLDDSLAAKGALPDDEDRRRQNRALAIEYILTGFSLATKAMRDPVERGRFEDLYEELHEELTSLPDH